MYYYVYTPGLKLIAEGNFAGMPFFMYDLPVEFPNIGNLNLTPLGYNADSYGSLFMVRYKDVSKLKSFRTIQTDLFIRLMEENSCNGLLVRTG